eukprot:Em0007g101a
MHNAKYILATNKLSLDESKARSSLKVLPEALQLLKSITKPVAVVSICGPCRTGKSYILSRVLGSGDAFALGHTTDAKTFGIWMGTSVLECDEFTMLLLDTEGIENVEAEAINDASILVLSVLLSSCFIYNSQGVPKKYDLNSMKQFEMITKSIIEKLGDDGSTPSKHFPDFIWLLRDVVLQLPVVDGQRLSPTDFLIQKVLNRSQGSIETKEDKVASAIMTSFSSVKCIMLPHPSHDAEVIQNIASQKQDLNPRFNKEVEAFVQQLYDYAKPNCGYEIGSKVIGTLLAEMVIKYVEVVNETGTIPCISDVWSATVEIECDKNVKELISEYDAEVSESISKRGMPMEEGVQTDEDKENPTTLLGIHHKIYYQTISTLIKRVGCFLTHQEIQDLTSKFTNAVVTFNDVPPSGKKISGGILKKHVDENYKQSQCTCRALFEQLFSPIKKKTELTAGNNYTPENLQHDLKILETEYHKQAVGPAKRKVYEEKKECIEETRRVFVETRKELKKLKDEVCLLKRMDDRWIEGLPQISA